ncbi:receptor-type tyrosine-protein phosphatase mu-like isoform X1 [Mizuhopecten yessoensis]|uniref:receptor-type tyrosine-protein phosphatase mu-like isoform X1 n=1 Tax=Mizuhopecten yessoensis TaxID=6573 RepID=UPI000B45DAEE|nr:receptor-type tyrosine-protein phosphatase mu-like isoform X1 [Mizuhopecten yessoensis]
MTRRTFILGGVVLYIICSNLLLIVELSEIVSRKKPTHQSSTYKFEGTVLHLSGNAVDGNTNQELGNNSCTYQAVGRKEVWWRVDLEREVTIDKVEIYYRDEGYQWTGWKNRFAGYEVYLSNTTDRLTGERCFIDESESVDQIISHVNHPECNGTAQYVTIYNHRESPKRHDWYFKDALLELCEVQVYGCEAGKYGNRNCDETCSSNCPGSVCHPSSGNCLYCGDNTYTRPSETSCRPCPESCAGPCDTYGNCNACPDGFYGFQCENTCSSTCSSNVCEKANGDCKACQDGFWGIRCIYDCSDTCESGVCEKTLGHCTADKQSGVEAIIVGASAGAGVGIAVVLFVFIVIFKRRSTTLREMTTAPSVKYEKPIPRGNSKNNSDETEEHIYLEIENVDIQDTSNDHENVYYNEGSMGYPVRQLKTMIAQKMADDAKQFVSEFKTFPLGATHPHTNSEKNKSKNRYKSIHPYDHSRVILDTLPGENGSDYINADYIDNVEAKKFYVATQGPLPNTTDDFWRMVWFLNSGKIVMLENLVENRKVKCAKYWPDEGDPMLTKTFDISQNGEHVYASHVVRNITVVDRKTKIKREIQQFHFTIWTDHDTPNTLDLVLFHRRVKLHKTVLPGQMVIHCSAGAGRTGIFIALDALLEFGKKHNRIDIRHFIHTMGKDRMNMVQTADQYVALHEMLAEAFDLQDSLIPKSMFAAKYHTLSTTRHAAQNQTQLSDEFKLMWDQKPDYKVEKDFQASLLPENRTKNRAMRILAVDRFRACLKSYASNSNDYINAVKTQSYTGQQGYIVTQFPLTDTRADFWTLVMDYKSDTVVILGDPRQASLNLVYYV